MSNIVPITYGGTATGVATITPSFRPSGNAWIDLVAPAAELAARIASTEFVPDVMRNKPAAITACILYGAEIGIGPMQSLSKVDIVKGRPAPRAELARALALGAGHEMWVQDSTNTRVTVCGHRRGSEHVMSVTWTMDDVKKAGLSNNQAYAKYPRQMLLARASAELARQMCPDALGGIGLFAEEADDLEPAAPASAPLVREKVTATTRKRGAPAPAALAAAPEPPLPGEDDPEPPPPAAGLVTDAQIKKMATVFGKIGIKERDSKLSVLSAIVDRPVPSSKDLTIDEASKCIDTLDAIDDGRAVIEVATDGTPRIVWPDLNDDQPPLPGEDWQLL